MAPRTKYNVGDVVAFLVVEKGRAPKAGEWYGNANATIGRATKDGINALGPIFERFFVPAAEWQRSVHPKIEAVARAIEDVVNDDCGGLSAGEKIAQLKEECGSMELTEFAAWCAEATDDPE